MRPIRIGGCAGQLRILLLATVTLVLTACVTGTVGIKGPPPTIPATLLEPCPPLPPALDSKLPALVENHRQITKLYHDCLLRHAALVKAVDTDEPSWWQFWKIWW